MRYIIGNETDYRVEVMYTTLVAIKARINGEWDCEELMQFGPMSSDTEEDILWMVSNVLDCLGE